MSERFLSEGLRGGVWTGTLTGAPPARLMLVVRGQVVGAVTAQPVNAESGTVTRISTALPVSALHEGAQTFLLVTDDRSGNDELAPDARVIGRLPVLAGQPLADDLIAEIALLRDELELVKSALRRVTSERATG